MGLLTSRGAFFIAGVGVGTFMSYNTNDMYFTSFKRNLYTPVRNELSHNPINWSRVYGTARKGIMDLAHEYF